MEMLEKISPSQKTIIRVLCYEIRVRNTDAVKFTIDDKCIESLTLYLTTHKYDTIMYLYGHGFLIELLKMYEECEKYEECQLIVCDIMTHNKIHNDNLKTF